jgi:uncharacterized protein involved in cysteine biosynthesis
MVAALLKTLTLFAERQFWRTIWQSLALTAAAFAALLALVWGVLAHAPLTAIGWLDTLVEVFGGLAVLALTWLLFPAVAGLVLSGFLERIIAAVEARYYPVLPKPRPLSWWTAARVALQFTAAAIGLNLLALPLYLVPVLNVVGFYGLNAYLLGREYFELVAMRRLDARGVRQLRRANRWRLLAAGLLIVGLLTVPVVHLLAPLMAAALMVHVVVALENPRRAG